MTFQSSANVPARLATYGIDEPIRHTLRRLAPELVSAIDRGIGVAVRAIAMNPRVTANMVKEGPRLAAKEAAYFNILFSDDFGDAYLQSSAAMIPFLVEIGLTPRSHVALSGHVLRACIFDLARKFKWRPMQFAEGTAAISATTTFDASNMFALYQDGIFRDLVARRESMEAAISSFEPVITDVTSAILNASGALDKGSAALKDLALRNVDLVNSASLVAAQSAQGMATSAWATEELRSSIDEIARAVAIGSANSARAADNAESAKNTLDDLVKISAQIGSVVTFISDVAQQTNLLALNATIEAARAGATGRGFVVVAAEVKDLSNRTAEAACEISQQIQTMRAGVVQSADRMSHAIKAAAEAASSSASIAVAIDQQRDVILSLAETAASMARVAELSSVDLANINESARRGVLTSEEIVGWSASLAASANCLQNSVSNHCQRLRKA